ncbi:hypothetical protein DPMN_167289 [Dreissena polymorpha]|uniref:Uncharacterized protein n=1 Tax=Dreissena polymorpha TaxID=45954 RepID=A0A9D4F0K8_DREPO|nr:hypothetical protein DPMN_167289 [Dreissena polymorpha]
MAANIKRVVETDMLGYRKGDKYLSSIVTNGFTNLAAKPQFIDDDSKVSIQYIY